MTFLLGLVVGALVVYMAAELLKEKLDRLHRFRWQKGSGLYHLDAELERQRRQRVQAPDMIAQRRALLNGVELHHGERPDDCA